METDTFHYNWGHVNSRGHWAMAALIAHHVFSQALIVLDEGPYDPLSETRHPMDRYIPGDEALAGERPQEEFFEVVNSIDAWKDETMWGQELVYEDIPRVRLQPLRHCQRPVMPSPDALIKAARHLRLMEFRQSRPLSRATLPRRNRSQTSLRLRECGLWPKECVALKGRLLIVSFRGRHRDRGRWLGDLEGALIETREVVPPE